VPLTLRQICQGFVPEHILHRMEEIGFVFPTDIQREALPTLFTGRDCILHAQVLFLIHIFYFYVSLFRLSVLVKYWCVVW
jgi:hypothetical protein